jgi:hypothetical protein
MKLFGKVALDEPFDRNDFVRRVSGLGKGTHHAFLEKNARGNPGEDSEVFNLVAPGRFRCIQTFRYNL